MKKIISGLILTLFLGSCVTRQACERRFPIERSDSISNSINTVTVIRDTTIYVQISGDTLSSTGLLTEVSRLSTSLATSTIWVSNGKINHQLEQRDTAIAATLKGVLKTSATITQKAQTTIQTQYINQLTGWQWTQVYLGRVFLGAIGTILLWNILKRNLSKV